VADSNAAAAAAVAEKAEMNDILEVLHTEGYVTKSASHKALKLIAWGKLTFDERLVVHRVPPVAEKARGPLFLYLKWIKFYHRYLNIVVSLSVVKLE